MKSALLAVALLTACASAQPTGPIPTNAAYLPPYGGQEASLFDDTFSGEVFGATADESEPLRPRASFADGIVPVRVRTVTRDATGDEESYLVEVVPAGPALKGPNPSSGLSLTVPASSPSFPLVRSVDAGLVGATLLLFYKQFQDSGSAVLHWRGELDTPRVRQVVDNARLMGELGR